MGVRGLDGIWAAMTDCIRIRSGDSSDEGSGLDPRGFARNEVLRRRTGPGPGMSNASTGNSSAGNCERSAMSHVLSCSGEDSITAIQGKRSNAIAAPKVSRRQSAGVQ